MAKFANYATRVGDFDSISFDALKIFVSHLTVNMVLKCLSASEQDLNDCLQASKMASMILEQFFQRKKSHQFKQFDILYSEIATLYSKMLTKGDFTVVP
jgi:hypothetical protein